MIHIEELKGKQIKLGEFDSADIKPHIVQNIKQKTGNTIIFTDRKTLNILNSKIPAFLEQIEVIGGFMHTPKKSVRTTIENLDIITEKKKKADKINKIKLSGEIIYEAEKPSTQNTKTSGKSIQVVTENLGLELTPTQKTMETALLNAIQNIDSNKPDAIERAKATCLVATALVGMERSRTEFLRVVTKK